MKLNGIYFLIGIFFIPNNLYAKKYEYMGSCKFHGSMGVFEECLDKELTTYDKELNTLYKALPKTKDLKNAERLWIKFREADCNYMAKEVHEGKAYQVVEKACSINRTKERIADLKRSYYYRGWFEQEDN
jgi:uncharacterized protein YecT (DUF1311 family)